MSLRRVVGPTQLTFIVVSRKETLMRNAWTHLGFSVGVMLASPPSAWSQEPLPNPPAGFDQPVSVTEAFSSPQPPAQGSNSTAVLGGSSPMITPASPVFGSGQHLVPSYQGTTPSSQGGFDQTNWDRYSFLGRVALFQETFPEGAPLSVVQHLRGRKPFESDHQFDGFIAPISNPVFSKEPRMMTELRPLFIAGWTRPGTPVVGRGDFQLYAAQARIALSERLAIIAEKDGILVINPEGGRRLTGLAKLSVGAKYALIRDVENQFLLTSGVQVEVPTGTDDVFEDRGSNLALFGSFGKAFGDNYHFLGTFGQNFQLGDQTSGFFFTSLHLDKQIGWFYPLVEVNWFYYNQPGNRLPINLEGDGLLNLGAANVNGKNLVSLAVGAKARLTQRAWLGTAYEFPLSTQTDLLGNRLLVELVLQY